MQLFWQHLSIVLRCGGLLLNLIFSFSSARCFRWPGYMLISVSFRFVIDVMLLHRECCTRLIRTIIIVQWAYICFCLSSTYPNYGPAATAHPLEFEVSRCRTSQFARSFLPALTRVWNHLPYAVFDSGTLDGFKGAVNRWFLPRVVFFSFPWRWCLWGCDINL